MAAGLGLVGFAIFGFRGGDAANSIAPVSGAVASPAVLNPITPDDGIAPPGRRDDRHHDRFAPRPASAKAR